MDIPKKAYYSISEVCRFTSLEPHVLRYWESEFPQLRPKKNRAGNRAYRDKDIEIIKNIKHLLYDEKFTISGARKKLSELQKTHPEQTPKEDLPKETTKDTTKETPEISSAYQMKLDLSLPGEISRSEIKNELIEILKIIGG
ncbi:MAG: MerR family transcriptional regulator [Fibrobacter sp.]|jgi:DNA-binding transcriptional MerR regulator|nr:MerR family transcriptional regulator [Fibrobacter sp.]